MKPAMKFAIKPARGRTARRRIRPAAYLVGMLAVLASGGCVTGGGGGFGGLGGGSSGGQRIEVGPKLSTAVDQPAVVSGGPKIHVVVPVFDPNIPPDDATRQKRGIHAELRRAEANRFAVKMQAALAATQAFGRVRVTPDATATAELYVFGKILTSNGEEVKIKVMVTDISGRRWLSRDFSHRVEASFHRNIRNYGQDGYAPVFARAAAHIVQKLNQKKFARLKKLQRLAEVRFAAGLSAEAFSRYLKVVDGRVELAAAPAEDDPALVRMQPLRVRDQLFVDRLQTHYADFDAKLNDSYLLWQQQSLDAVKEARKAKKSSVVKTLLGGLLVVAGVAAGLDGGLNAGEELAAAGAVVAGAVALGQGFGDRAEMRAHRDTLAELGQSLDIKLAPQVVEYEQETARLNGDSAAQYRQWIAFLKKIHALEATPDTQL